MNNKVIGIISYLPDNTEIRQNRFSKLLKLIDTCNKIFDLPIYIVIQNYTNKEILYLVDYKNVELSENYNRLGIVGARKKLRESFLSSEYDYLIMLDDDCELFGDRLSGIEYLKQIDDNPNKFYEFNKTLLKLFAISKEIFKLEDFEDINPENGDGFEDRVFVNKLREKYSDKLYVFNKVNLKESSISTKDKYSTWYTNQDLKRMLDNTYNCIEKYKN